MFKLYGNKASTFIILSVLVLVISFPGIASTTKATTTTANNWKAQPLFLIRPTQTGATPTGYSPQQIITAYDLTSITNGAGTTIAIIDAYNDPTIASDLAYFSNTYGLPAPTATNFIIHKMATTIQNSPDWAVEISLDVEWAHAIAPDATILLVEAQSTSLANLLAAVNYATTYNQAGVPPVKVVSISWGGGEFSGELADDSYFTSTTVNPNIVFFASIGDSGAGVEWPSCSTNVVSVGGTSLNVTLTGALISETAWSDSGGGESAYEPQPVYQANYGLTYANRTTPDVSYDANPSTGVSIYDSTPYEGYRDWFTVGGTSVGAPSWAAIQALGQTAGNSNFYSDATTAYSSYFRDITVGSNGYPAGIGYDLVTGLGSPVTTNFTLPTTPDFSITASPPNPITINAGSFTTSTITVTPLKGFEGSVTLSSTSGWASFASNPITASGILTISVPSGTASGTYSVTITGVSGSISHSTTITVQVLPLSYEAAVSPSSVAVDVGQLQTFMASASGGITPYTYQWYLDGSEVGTNSTSYTFNATDVGSFSLYVNVIDSSSVPKTVYSNTASVTVNSALVTPSVTPAPGTVDRGKTSTLTFTAVTTGTGPYTYQWMEMAPEGSSYSLITGTTSDSYVFDTSGLATGTWSFVLQVTDSTGAAVNSTAASVTVNSAPTVNIAPVGPVTLDVGQSQTFAASASGGTGTLAYQWSLKGSPVGSDSNTYSFSESAGSYSVTCTVTDSASVPVSSAASNAVSVTVNQLTITVTQGANGVIAPGTTTVNYGDSQTFTITPDTGYYIVGVTVDGSSVGVVSSYTFTNVQAAYTISATFALTPTTTPTATPTPAATPTSMPTATPTSTTAPSPTPTSTATTVSPNQAQTKSLLQDAIYGIATAVAIVVIVAVVLVLRKSKKAVYAQPHQR